MFDENLGPSPASGDQRARKGDLKSLLTDTTPELSLSFHAVGQKCWRIPCAWGPSTCFSWVVGLRNVFPSQVGSSCFPRMSTSPRLRQRFYMQSPPSVQIRKITAASVSLYLEVMHNNFSPVCCCLAENVWLWSTLSLCRHLTPLWFINWWRLKLTSFTDLLAIANKLWQVTVNKLYSCFLEGDLHGLGREEKQFSSSRELIIPQLSMLLGGCYKNVMKNGRPTRNVPILMSLKLAWLLGN